MPKSRLLAKAKRRPSKYASKAAVGSDGFRYDSKAEMRRGEQLIMLRKAGDVRLLLRQVPLDLPGGGRLVIDFVWIGSHDNVIHFEDVKSPATEAKETFRLKRRQVEQYHDIEIEIWMWGR